MVHCNVGETKLLGGVSVYLPFPGNFLEINTQCHAHIGGEPPFLTEQNNIYSVAVGACVA